jgi:hypothetical protein
VGTEEGKKKKKKISSEEVLSLKKVKVPLLY